MADFRKRTRTAVYDALVSPTFGLNAKLAAAAPGYGVTAPTFDLAAGSSQFLQGFLLPEALDLSPLIVFPALVLYTSSARTESGREKFRKWTGDVQVESHFYLEQRAGREKDNTEVLGDLLEDAFVEVLNAARSIFEGAGVTWGGDYSCDRDPVVQLENGWAQRIPISTLFEVTV